MTKVNEYLFIDNRRLESYFEQVASTAKLVGLPSWKVGLQLTGFTVERTQSTSIQPFTVHEKVKQLMLALDPHRGNPSAFGRDEGDFVFETLDAVRALIPTNSIKGADMPWVPLWLCTRAVGSDSYQGFRYLIEDFHKDDEPRRRSSGFSVLSAMFSELRAELAHSPLAEFAEYSEATTIVHLDALTLDHLDNFAASNTLSLDEQVRVYLADKEQTFRDVLRVAGVTEYDAHPARYRGVDANRTHYYEITVGDIVYTARTNRFHHEGSGAVLEIYRDRPEELERRFAWEPSGILAEIGAILSPPRRVDALYRIRQSGETLPWWTRDSEPRRLSIVGYPIFISASPSTFYLET